MTDEARGAYDDALAVQGEIEAKHYEQNARERAAYDEREARRRERERGGAAERILDEVGDWQADDDVCGRCATCWHPVPGHAERCALWRLALMVVDLRA